MTGHVTKSTRLPKHVQLPITFTHINARVSDSIPTEISEPKGDDFELSGSLRKPLDGVCGEGMTVLPGILSCHGRGNSTVNWVLGLGARAIEMMQKVSLTSVNGERTEVI